MKNHLGDLFLCLDTIVSPVKSIPAKPQQAKTSPTKQQVKPQIIKQILASDDDEEEEESSDEPTPQAKKQPRIYDSDDDEEDSDEPSALKKLPSSDESEDSD